MDESIQTPRLSCMEAIRKWGFLCDSAIGGIGNKLEVRIANLVSAGATETMLRTFWSEVKHLTWVSTFGQSPWETAASLGAALEARALGKGFEAVGQRYIEPFLLALAAKQSAISAPCSSLKPYRVMLLETPGDKFKLAFDCDAEDPDHAAEQAESAYPGCVVMTCTEFDDGSTQNVGGIAA